MERCSSGGILSSLLSRSGDTEGANNQTVVNIKTTDANINKTVKAAPDDVVLVRARKSSQEPCGHQCKRIKQVSKESFVMKLTQKIFLKFMINHEMSNI